MLLLALTTDKLQLTTSAVANVDVHASYMDASQADPPTVKGSTSGNQNTNITTATTADIVAAPAASTTRNIKTLHIRNKHATNSVDVTVLFNANGTTFELHKATLTPGSMLDYVEGVGFFLVTVAATTGVFTNRSTASSGAGFATDTYINGSAVPMGVPGIGWTYSARFDVTKTAGGTATPIVTLRTGTTATTADTARCTFTFGAGTAAADTAVVTVTATFRSVGPGTSAVLAGQANADSLPTTGWAAGTKAVVSISAGFDSTVASSFVGLSYNGGTSASHTIQQITAAITNY